MDHLRCLSVSWMHLLHRWRAHNRDMIGKRSRQTGEAVVRDSVCRTRKGHDPTTEQQRHCCGDNLGGKGREIEDTRRIPWTRRRPPLAARHRCGLWAGEGIDEDDGDLHSRSDGVYRAFRTDEKTCWAEMGHNWAMEPTELMGPYVPLFLWIFCISPF